MRYLRCVEGCGLVPLTEPFLELFSSAQVGSCKTATRNGAMKTADSGASKFPSSPPTVTTLV